MTRDGRSGDLPGKAPGGTPEDAPGDALHEAPGGMPEKAPDDAPGDATTEPDAVRQRYARRAGRDWRYDRLNPAALLPDQERERAIARVLLAHGWHDPGSRRVLEVGCGDGSNLLTLLRLGIPAGHLAGIDLLAERCAQARARLPAATRILEGDATALALPSASQDLVLQFTVFSSLLDDAYQQRLADTIWRWLRPGGALLWYDFVHDNPANRDVRGVPLARVRTLFPQGRLTARRLTLAPPLARAAVRLHPAFYTALNLVPLLRTHRLAWIEKPSG